MKRKILVSALLSGLVCACICFCGILTFKSTAQTANAQKTYAELWTAGEQTTVTANVDLPLYATTGEVKGTSLPQNELPSWRKNGVEIRAEGALNMVEFKNIIDIDGFTSNDRLIDILPVTSVQGAYDFNKITITLTDADDQSTWFSVNITGVDTQWRAAGSYISVSTSSGASGGYRWGYKYSDVYNSTEFDINSFLGTVTPANGSNLSAKDYMALPYSVRFDEAEQIVYVLDSFNGLQTVYDLDHTATVGVGKEFAGFKNNRVKLSISISSIANTPSSYIVLNVANHGMDGSTIVDELAPSCLIDVPSVLPLAEVGLPYKVFSAEFYDFEDGQISYATKVKAPDENEFVDISGSFTPTKSGEYVLRYVGTDSSEKSSIKDITILARHGVPSAEINVVEPSGSFSVGQEITVPIATVTGGSGIPILEVKVENTYGSTVLLKDGKFTPTVAGNYRVTYVVTDYLDRIVTKCIDYKVDKTNKVVFKSSPIMYSKFVSGVLVELPKINAVDYYSMPGQGLNATTEITVKGTGDKASYSERLENYRFTPNSERFGDGVIVEYKIYCKNYPEQAEILTYTVPIYKPNYIWEYFVLDDSKISVSYNSQEELKNDNDSYVSFNALSVGDRSFEFVNPLRAEGFAFQFAVLEEAKGFEKIKVSLKDYYNSNIVLSYEIEEKDADNTYVTCNGVKREMIGGLTSNAVLRLEYKNNAIYDYNGNLVVECADFNGFPSGKVWAEISVIGAQTGAGVKISRLGSQPLGAAYRSGALNGFSDSIAPDIVLSAKLNIEPFYNELVKIPSATAYDICSPVVDVTCTLTDPNGKVLIDNQLADGSQSFRANIYGTYTLVYKAKDSAGRTKTQTYSLNLYDVDAPVIYYSGDTVINGKVNEEITFKSALAFDGLDEKVNLVVYIIHLDGYMENITEKMKFTPTKVGRYTLRYYAYDANYNYAMTNVSVIVAEKAGNLEEA